MKVKSRNGATYVDCDMCEIIEDGRGNKKCIKL